jgi:hypothetical protein
MTHWAESVVNFLDQLKSQADALRSQNQLHAQNLEAVTSATEDACRVVWSYIAELAPQLNVICPDGPSFSLDDKSKWPAMQCKDFRVDSRRKFLRNQELCSSMSMGWRIVPRSGPPVHDHVSVNFPPELKRVEERLSAANLMHERKEIRHPATNKLQAIKFEYMTELRGSLMVTPEHDVGTLLFRFNNVSGFEVLQRVWAVAEVNAELMDELAKLIVGQPSRFIARQ